MHHDSTATSVRLDREWSHMNHRPALVHRAAAWRVTDDPPTALDDVLRAVGWPSDYTRAADRRLHRLLQIAQTDDLAGRVIVQRLKPALLSRTRKHRTVPDAFEELLASAWIVIRTYNPDRRPSSLAASLVSDIEYRTFRVQRRRIVTEHPLDSLDLVPLDLPRDPRDELTELLEDARCAGMPADELDLARRLMSNPCTETLAGELEVTARTVRNRRVRVAEKLRAIALAA